MRIVVRVDASDLMGTGHFMRCLTLADALGARGAKVRFVSRHLPAHLHTMLEDHGHDLTMLSAVSPAVGAYPDSLSHASWLGTSQETDVMSVSKAIAPGRWDWVVIDHYALDWRWEQRIRPLTDRILVVDDLADRTHFCDVLVDQNVNPEQRERYLSLVPPGCQTLLGPKFALLRDEFRQLRPKSQPRPGVVRRVLVFFGGVDADNYTARAMDALVSVRLTGVQVDVVIGETHRHRAALESACASYRFTPHVQTTKMAQLMAVADLSIGAAGSSSWERCCLGLPAICVVAADNQRAIAKGLDNLGAILLVGRDAPATSEEMHAAIRSLMSAPDRVQAMSEASYKLVDGMGVSRVCDTMMAMT